MLAATVRGGERHAAPVAGEVETRMRRPAARLRRSERGDGADRPRPRRLPRLVRDPGRTTRAAILERLADLLEAHRDELMAICVQEAFKTHPRRDRRGARGGRFLPLLRGAGARRTCSRSSCPGRPASATRCISRGAASGRRSRRGISRWRSSWGRPRRRWSRATPSSPSPRRRRRGSPRARSSWRTRRACRPMR